MKFLIDFSDSVSPEDIESYLIENECTVEKVFNHFENTYLVTSDTVPPENEIVTSCMREDDDTAIQLLETTYTFPPLRTIAVKDEDTDWWKYAIFSKVSELLDGQPTVDVLRKGRNHPVYLLDSGVNSTHPDFVNANIRKLFSFVEDDTDTRGHGTALASVIVGETAGISDAEVIDVKIFHEGQSTLRSDIVAALDAVALDYLANYSNIPAIVNMSWGITRDTYIDEKITNLIDMGLIVVAAAGNNGVPIEDVTPAALPAVITVGSVGLDLLPSDFTNYTDSAVSFTADPNNHGVGLDIWAPGEFIHAAKLDGTFANIAGTSAAAAIFSAASAYMLAQSGWKYGLPVPVYHPDLSDAVEMTDTTVTDRNLVRGSITNAAHAILVSRVAVQVSGIYAGCTDKLVTISDMLAKPIEDNSTVINFVAKIIMTGVGEPIYLKLFDDERFHEITLGDLPTGLTFDGEFLTGQLDSEIAEEKIFEIIYIPVTFSDGTNSFSDYISIIKFDRTRFEPGWTGSDAARHFLESEEADLILYADCYSCAGTYSAMCGSSGCCICGYCITPGTGVKDWIPSCTSCGMGCN